MGTSNRRGRKKRRVTSSVCLSPVIRDHLAPPLPSTQGFLYLPRPPPPPSSFTYSSARPEPTKSVLAAPRNNLSFCLPYIFEAYGKCSSSVSFAMRVEPIFHLCGILCFLGGPPALSISCTQRLMSAARGICF